MKRWWAGMLAGAGLMVGCGQNEPETMGGEPGTPRTVATGAPAEAAKGSAVSNPEASAIESEQGSATFDRTNEGKSASDVTRPDASTVPPPPLDPESTNRTTR